MNYYHATEKKPEHGGGWAFMQHNRREGSMIMCACGAGGWTDRGHLTAEDAERCFYDLEQNKGVRWSRYSEQAYRCEICTTWTPDFLEAASHLVQPTESVCKFHFKDDADAADWLWEQHPFSPGISIMASW
jgi:hypothetical protein